ncbi:MAG: tetraacyldisaccharide 4'-kinase [Gammaproteobacteria bacterium]|nr:tetraacyldisaccharide 4'-kinase [Gammaproteobacteria bacterium]
MSLRGYILTGWQQPGLLNYLLWPLSLFYRLMVYLRRAGYQAGLLRSGRIAVPIIVVGNLSVGGSGKTPLVICLVEALKQAGFKPGVVSRGYGGHGPFPLLLDDNCTANQCGDEPLLIQQRTSVPVAVAPRRTDALALLQQAGVNVVISDDGLQHYAMQRDIEICLLDQTRPQHNQFLLPAGPLREPLSRLDGVDMVVEHHSLPSATSRSGFTMYLQPGTPKRVTDDTEIDFDPQSVHWHAVAGIGQPERFFLSCEKLGWQIERHAYADHHPFIEQDISYGDERPTIMTEKDAVKCRAFAGPEVFYLPVDAKLSAEFTDKIISDLTALQNVYECDVDENR